MDSLAYFRAVRRHWVIVVACVVVGAVLGAATTALAASGGSDSRSAFKATHTLFFEPSQSPTLFRSAFSNLDQMAVLTTTGPVPNAVADELGTTETGRQLAERITTLANPTTNTLEITAVDRDRDRTVVLADAFADALVANLLAKDSAELENMRQDALARVADLQDQIDAIGIQLVADPPNPDVLRARLDSVTARYGDAYDTLQQLEDTDAPVSPLSTLERADPVPVDESEYDSRLSLGRLGTNNVNLGAPTGQAIGTDAASSPALDGAVPRGVLGAILGLFAGFGLAIFADRLDHRLRTREAVEAAFQLPVLADVPSLVPNEEDPFAVVAHDSPVSPAAETFRAIRSALLFQHAVGLAAAGNGNAYSEVPRNDASFDSDRPDPMIVMVASASPREGKTTTSANLAAVFAETGSSVLVVNCDFRRPLIHRYLGIDDEPRRVAVTRIPGVKGVANVLDDPDANPALVVAEQRRLVNAARGQFDVMILDTAPLLSANDAVELVGSTDLVLIVAKAEQSTSTDAARAMEMLERVNAPVAGVAFIGGAEAPSSYYYNYYRRDAEPQGGRRRRKGAPHPIVVSTNGKVSSDDATVAEPHDEPQPT